MCQGYECDFGILFSHLHIKHPQFWSALFWIQSGLFQNISTKIKCCYLGGFLILQCTVDEFYTSHKYNINFMKLRILSAFVGQAILSYVEFLF